MIKKIHNIQTLCYLDTKLEIELRVKLNKNKTLSLYKVLHFNNINSKMKFLYLIIATILIEESIQSDENQTELVEKWKEFKHSNTKSYHSSTEETKRFVYF